MEKEALREEVLRLGAYRAEFIETERIEADASFRKLCESNACGNYGRSYMCPPDVGEVETLMGRLKDYRLALVYQTVGTLEDSYDFEGMMEAGKRHNDLTQQVRRLAEQLDCEKTLHLGAGGCRVCDVCGKKTGDPCRHPEQAMSSLEAYGINVSTLAAQCGMRYINGKDTVTYFGAVFFS